MVSDTWRAGAADRLPDDIHDFGLECTHDDGEVLPQVVGVGCTRHETGTNPTTGGWSPTKRVQERIVELQLADPGLELLDELTECAILGLKVDVARYAG